MFFILCSNF